MADTKIEWAEKVWNPLHGCTKVSQGCKNCYAIRQCHMRASNPNPKIAARFAGLTQIKGGKPEWTGRVNLHDDVLLQPLSWKKPCRVFLNSLSDLFQDAVPFDFVDKAFAVMALTPHITYQVLTKRPELMAEYFNVWAKTNREAMRDFVQSITGDRTLYAEWPLPNVWLGTSIEAPDVLSRANDLERCPAAVRFWSVEPQMADLGDVSPWLGRGAVHWVICGGESGHGARPMHPDWARSLRDQCVAAGVPFLFKQWGEYVTEDQSPEDIVLPGISSYLLGEKAPDFYKVGKHKSGRILDGREWNEFPKVAA